MTDKDEHSTTEPEQSEAQNKPQVPVPSEDGAANREPNTDLSIQGDSNIVSENTEAKNEEPLTTDDDDLKTDYPVTTEISKDMVDKAKAAHSKPVQSENSDAVEGGAAEVGNTTNDLQQAAIKAMAMKAEKERLAREKHAADAERALFNDDMLLRLDVIESSQPITLEVAGDLIVGRADNVTDYIPEIDLTPHGAYRLGLSRRHALIRKQDGGLIVKDLSSRNGTFVNGEQVKSGGSLPLRDGDELRFGNLALRVNFQRKN